MVITSLITPMKEDTSVDWESLEKLLKQQFTSAVEGVLVLGTTGETPTLSNEEKDQIIQKTLAVRRESKSPKKIWVGVSTNSTATIQSHIEALNELDIDGYLISTPWYNKPNQKGIYEHFMAADKVSKKPIMAYNVPSRCGVKITPETFAKLYQDSRYINCLKDAGGDIAAHMQFVEMTKNIHKPNGTKACILSGDDALTLPFMSVGAAGVVGVLPNLYPNELSEMVELFKNQELKKSQQLHYQLLKEMERCFADTNPIPIKHMLFEKGLIKSNQVRLPLTRFDQ